MPQMSPLYWFILYLYFTLLFFGFNLMVYYLIMYFSGFMNLFKKIFYNLNLWW